MGWLRDLADVLDEGEYGFHRKLHARDRLKRKEADAAWEASDKRKPVIHANYLAIFPGCCEENPRS